MLKTTPKTQLLYINIKQYLLRAMLKTASKTQLLYINIKQYLLRFGYQYKKEEKSDSLPLKGLRSLLLPTIFFYFI
jgi:hypothetical protein